MVASSLVNIFFAVLCLTALISAGHGYLTCYECKASDPAVNCTNTNINSLVQQKCSSGETEMDHYSSAMDKALLAKDATNGTAFCYSIYFKDAHNVNNTGIYRGCYFPTTTSICQELGADLAKSPNTKGEITECHVCNTNNCNNHHVNEATFKMAFSSSVLVIFTLLISKF